MSCFLDMSQDETMSRTVGFVKGSTTDKLYRFIIKKRAVTSDEVWEEFNGLIKRKSHLPSYPNQLAKIGFYYQKQGKNPI